MEKFCILTDSSCDIDDQTALELGLYVMRMPIVVNGREYLDAKDISNEEVKDFLKSGTPVKTSQTTLGVLIESYEYLLKSYEYVIHIPLSSGLSGMYQTALAQAKNYDGRVVVIDAKCACYPVTRLCLDIKELMLEGHDPIEIKEAIEKETSMMEAIIIPADIKYLKMGGRITPAAAALANLLRITPVLYLKEGKIDVYDKVHTIKKAITKGMEPILAVENVEDYYWMVISDECDELAEEVKNKLAQATGQEVELHDFGPVILSHTGPGTLAFGRIKKLKI